MNKFGAFIVLALVAVACADPIIPADVETDTETFLNPDNSEEALYLIGNKKIFTDFCIASRDYVYNDIKTKTNGMAGWMFRLVFSSAGAIAQDAIDTQRMAVDRLGNQIEHPDAAIAAATNSVEEVVAEGQKQIQETQTQPKTLYQAFLATIGATRNVVADKVSAGFADLSSRVGLDKAISLLDDACNKIASYEAELRQQFNAYKEEAKASDPTIADATFESVPCVTSIRVVRADGACKFAKAAQGPVTKILTTARQN